MVIHSGEGGEGKGGGGEDHRRKKTAPNLDLPNPQARRECGR